MWHQDETCNLETRTRHGYWRLLGYVRPYWKRLAVGIIAGMLVGGSVFVSLLTIPQMIGVVDIKVKETAQNDDTARRIVAAVEKSSAGGEAEKIAAVQKAMTPDTAASKDPQLDKMLNTASKIGKNLHLPFSIDGTTIHVTWPKEFSFEAVSPEGKVAWQLFGLYVAMFILAWVFKNLARYINAYCTRWVGSRVVADLRAQIFSRLMRQSLKYFGKNDVGQLISRAVNDTAALEYSITHSVEDLTNAPLQIIGCVAAIIVACREYNNYSLIVMLLVGPPLLLVPMQLLGRVIRKYYRKSYARIADVMTRMHEAFSCIRVVKAYNTEEIELDRFRFVNRKYFRQTVRAMRLHVLVSPMIEILIGIAAMGFLFYSYRSGVSVTQLTALFAPALMAYQPLKELSKVIAIVQQSMAAADRIFDLLDTDMELPEKADAAALKEFSSGIEVRNVTFSYDDHTVIDNVSFSIPKGSMVAVVGETGSGKSTLANLIARFYDVSDGQVLIDGKDIRDYTIASLRRQIGVVNQNPMMFNDTIADNIAYGTPEASRDDVIAAAKLANAHDFISGGVHAEGYDTVVGENGFKLSGGEKQRIAIARAILKNPPILILDEATSALDNVTERLVQDALNRVMGNRTVFAIAHRLTTIQHADKIIVMSRGKIVECGTHDELLAKNGVYRKLHDTQFEH